jgi:predicted amidohydrolase
VLFGGNGRKDDLVLEGIRVIDPTEGIDEVLTVTVEKGVITRLEHMTATAHG